MQLSYFDIVDENDNLLGTRADYNVVHSKGLWHRGVHVLLYTPDRKIVMQKRAISLKYHPDEVEISVGGGVDAGETPEQAAIREVKEEMGITLKPADLHFVGKTKYNHATKTLLIRNFVYSYTVCLPETKLNFHINAEETSSVFMLSERQLRAALRRHRVLHVGKISSTYAYWKYLLDSMPVS